MIDAGICMMLCGSVEFIAIDAFLYTIIAVQGGKALLACREQAKHQRLQSTGCTAIHVGHRRCHKEETVEESTKTAH